MNGMFQCVVCGYSVDPKAESTAELVTGWLVKGRILKTVSSTYRFAHKVCIESKPPDNQISMF